MPHTLRTRFVDQLPAVFRQDERQGENFLGRFLKAFEVVFAGVEGEIEAIPGIFSVTPDPALERDADVGSKVLRLDSAAGLCPGDVALLEPPAESGEEPEFVTVAAADGPLPADAVALAGGLRFAHTRLTRVRVLGEPGRTASLALPAEGGDRELRIPEAGFLGVGHGVALRIDDFARPEYVYVVEVDGGRVTVAPPLLHPHEPGTAATPWGFAPRRTPPAAFAWAPRTGSELVLDAFARKEDEAAEGDRFLELDTLAGVEPGDVLRIRDFDPARVEFVRVAALPLAQEGPALFRRGVQLERGIRYAHAVGTGVDIPRIPSGATLLSAAIRPDPQTGRVNAGRVEVLDAGALGAGPGDVVVIGAEWKAGRPVGGEWAEVRNVLGNTLALSPALQAPAAKGSEIVRVVPEGGALDALEWLAGWIGLALRPGRGERWNRDLVRRAGRIWPVRGTREGVEAFLDAYLRGEASTDVFDPSNPLQVGLVSTVGVDTIICGGEPWSFWVDLHAEPRSMRLHTPEGMEEMVHAAHEALLREKPAHATYTLRVHAPSIQIGTDPDRHVGARVGETTLLWSRPLVVAGDR